jgi:hypothetical protein
MSEKNNNFYNYKNNIKSRLNYPSGASECPPKCKCLFCRRERGEDTYHKEVDHQRKESESDKKDS